MNWALKFLGMVVLTLGAPFYWLQRKNSKQTVRPAQTVERRTDVASMKRGVGYCENTDCEEFCKGVFLLNHGDVFYCPRCRQIGQVEKEKGTFSGEGDVFKEVRVEFNFDPVNKNYREIAVVRDDSLWGSRSTYTLQSPLIKSERRALKVAEAVLANLNRYRGLMEDGELPRTTELQLSFDDDYQKFKKELDAVFSQISQSQEAQVR